MCCFILFRGQNVCEKARLFDRAFNLPYYRELSRKDKLTVCGVEVSATEETVMRRKRAWMRCRKNSVVFIGDKCFFFFCVSSPKEKNDFLFAFVELSDYCIRKLFPAASSVRVCLSLAYGERRVEKKNSLLCPAGEVA